MDNLSFAAKVIEATAWPLSLIAVVAMLKRSIAQLVPKLKQLKYRDLQVEFEESVRKVERQAESANLPSLETTTGHEDLASEKEGLFVLAQTHPRAALFEAWVRLEVAIGQALRNAKIITDGEKKTATYLPFEGAKHLFSEFPEQLAYLTRLRDLRNRLAHGDVVSISADSACAFIEMAFRLVLFIEEKWPNKRLQPTLKAAPQLPRSPEPDH